MKGHAAWPALSVCLSDQLVVITACSQQRQSLSRCGEGNMTAEVTSVLVYDVVLTKSHAVCGAGQRD